MKIVTPLPPPVLPRQDGPSDTAAGPRSARSTFGFDELGVFGLKQQQPIPDKDGGRTPKCPEPVPSDPGKAPGPQVGTSLPLDINAGRHSSPSPLPKPDRPLIHADPGEPRPQPEPHMVEIGAAGELVEIELSVESSASVRTDEAPEASPRTQVTRPGFNLQLAEKGGQVSIAASAPPLDGEGRALLRRLVREILADRGLRLADFQLNGVPLAADFPYVTGGSHGSRSR